MTVDDVRALAATLPRSYEAIVRGRLKLRVGSLVYVAFSRDQTVMGFAFPKHLRDALIDADPHKFLLPEPSDLRFNWVCARLAALDRDELDALVLAAWRMCVPKKIAASIAPGPPRHRVEHEHAPRSRAGRGR